MLTEILIFILTFIIIYFVYTHKRILSYFDQHDLKYLPGVPVFGNIWKNTFLKTHIVEDIIEVYNSFPEERYVGYIESTLPIIMIRDPEIIKNITVKDFDHFTDHREFIPTTDPLFGASIFFMKGDRWRSMRAILSPAFTGSKMRLMMPFMTEVSQNVIEFLKENKTKDIDVSDVMRRYTNDVIASAAFGLQVNSFKDKNNEFYVIGQSLFNFTLKQRLYLFLFAAFPYLSKKLAKSFFPKRTRDFFRNIVLDTIKFRRENKVERPDMIQLLMEVSEGTLKIETNQKDEDSTELSSQAQTQKNLNKWTLDELSGQVFVFFGAGFETSSGALVTTVHELALNSEVQEKLYQEMKAFQDKGISLTFENINELKYLDCVMNETMRKWAAAIIMDRVCTHSYELPPPRPGAKPYRVNPGDVVYNVVNGIHLDPKYYPEPHKFIPERFSEENKHKLKPFTYFPFGNGPRICIGKRFAILEIKVLLYNLILNFKFLKCARTSDPIKLATTDFNIKVKGGSWVRVEERK